MAQHTQNVRGKRSDKSKRKRHATVFQANSLKSCRKHKRTAPTNYENDCYSSFAFLISLTCDIKWFIFASAFLLICSVRGNSTSYSSNKKSLSPIICVEYVRVLIGKCETPRGKAKLRASFAVRNKEGIMLDSLLYDHVASSNLVVFMFQRSLQYLQIFIGK